MHESYIGKVHYAESRMCQEFIENLYKSQSDYFIDILENDKSIEAIGRRCIIQFEGNIAIPEEFDDFSILNSLPKDFVEKQLTSEVNNEDKDIVKAFFKIKKGSIPIIIDYEDKLICAKLHAENFTCEYEEFEEYIDEDLTVIARVISPTKSRDKEIFNPLKDFFSISRASRRAINEDIEGLENIYVDKNYMDVEILAILQ